MMIIQNNFNLGQFVYLITDNDQRQRLVTAICVRTNFLEYQLSLGSGSSWHQEFEISETVDVLRNTTS